MNQLKKLREQLYRELDKGNTARALQLAKLIQAAEDAARRAENLARMGKRKYEIAEELWMI